MWSPTRHGRLMTEDIFAYLRRLLSSCPVTHPITYPYAFMGNFRANHRQCHLTAMQVGIEAGHDPVLGIEFLDLNGKLYPWPHMINRGPMGLVDHSPPPEQPKLGFVETGWAEFAQWREVTRIYDILERSAQQPRWGVPAADALTDDFLAVLRASTPVTVVRPGSR